MLKQLLVILTNVNGQAVNNMPIAEKKIEYIIQYSEGKIGVQSIKNMLQLIKTRHENSEDKNVNYPELYNSQIYVCKLHSHVFQCIG